ncbi:MAG TPA: beta-hydroxyacyl-ACP dehydratase [Phycisphaerae bacterium]|nr:beta-hydroxyacyl-ACP dehydratase [Phycisphaerae bacterium]
MKFCLVDRLVSIVPAQSIIMAKNVSIAEEYLDDHFPGFPVLPGVLMLEASIQAAAWLVRQWDGFAHSLIVLKEARGIRYGTFVEPGRELQVRADVLRLDRTSSEFKIRGSVGEATAIQGRIELAHLNLADIDPALASLDKTMIEAMSKLWKQFDGPHVTIDRDSGP